MNRPDAETQREDRTTGEERYWEYVAAKASLVDDVDDMRQPSSGLARFARRAEFNSLRSGVGVFLARLSQPASDFTLSTVQTAGRISYTQCWPDQSPLSMAAAWQANCQYRIPKAPGARAWA